MLIEFRVVCGTRIFERPEEDPQKQLKTNKERRLRSSLKECQIAFNSASGSKNERNRTLEGDTPPTNISVNLSVDHT